MKWFLTKLTYKLIMSIGNMPFFEMMKFMVVVLLHAENRRRKRLANFVKKFSQ